MAYNIFVVVLCLLGQILLQIYSGFNPGQYLYYTNLSNLLCLAYFVLSIIYGARHWHDADIAYAPRFQGAVCMAITVTMLIYWFVLRQQGFFMGDSSGGNFNPSNSQLYAVSDYIVHLLVPLSTLLYWILFMPKGRFRRYGSALWLVIPLVYYLLAIVVAQTGYTYRETYRYPYFFIDPDVIGVSGVALFVPALILIFLGIGYIVYGFDRLFTRFDATKEQ